MRHILLGLCLLGACADEATAIDSGSETDTDADADSDADSDADADADADSDADTDTDADTDLAPPYCTQGCVTPADCSAGTDAYDADNYQCLGGACEYTGCNSTAECQASLGTAYVCADFEGVAYDYCQLACTVPGDCDIGGGSVYDADNYECIGQVCRWQGCASHAECVDTLGSGYVCHDNGVIPACLEACTTPADCGTGFDAYDADNYRCDGGACVYTGCNGDGECVDIYGADAACLD